MITGYNTQSHESEQYPNIPISDYVTSCVSHHDPSQSGLFIYSAVKTLPGLARAFRSAFIIQLIWRKILISKCEYSVAKSWTEYNDF